MSDPLRETEVNSIRAFVQAVADEGYLSGRVLDYGCGKQPYRDIVETHGGHYSGFDRKAFPANVSGVDFGDDRLGDYRRWDTILCTQVVQYVPIEQDTDEGDGLQGMLGWFHSLLQWYDPDDDPPRLVKKRGYLVLTYPTNWPEVEPEDLYRFTKAGMERLLTEAGFTIIRHDWRHGFSVEGNSFTAGYGVIARA